MREVIQKLKEYGNQIDLKSRFAYGFDIYDELFEHSESKTLSNEINPYDQNVKLKWILNKKYKKTPIY